MSSNKLVITYKPDVLSMVHHNGSFKTKKDKWGHPTIKVNSNYKGLTARSERESFSNIKTVEAAKRIILRRNVSEIIFASFNGEEINVHPAKKEKITFYKRLRRKIKSIYSNDYSKIKKQSI